MRYVTRMESTLIFLGTLFPNSHTLRRVPHRNSRIRRSRRPPLAKTFRSLIFCQVVCAIIIIILSILFAHVRSLYLFYLRRSFAVHARPRRSFISLSIFMAIAIYYFIAKNSRSPARLMTPSARHKSRRLDLLFRDLRQSKKCRRRSTGTEGPRRDR